MKPQCVLLYTHDRSFDRVLSGALAGIDALVLIARSVSDALQVVSGRGGELDFAILDFNGVVVADLAQRNSSNVCAISRLLTKARSSKTKESCENK
jgi:hypothetical protein